jgi:N-acetylglucosamine-6-sulfatase
MNRSWAWLAAALVAAAAGGAVLAWQLRDGGSDLAEGEGPFGPSEPPAQIRPHGGRPNLVLIVTDDQEASTLRYMPKTRALIGRRGVEFADAQSSFPLCCPARVSLLTGQYAHNHGVTSNFVPQGGWQKFNRGGGEARTLPVALQRAGYNTIFVGKYLNGWGLGRDRPDAEPLPVPPGWNEFIGAVGLSVYRMWGFTLDHNGVSKTYPDDPSDAAAYQTDVFARVAEEQIRRYAREPRPFMISVNTGAPHTEENEDVRRGRIRPAPRHRGDYPKLPLLRTPSFNETDISDKPPYLRARPSLTLRAIQKLEGENRTRVRSLQSVDDLVARVVGALGDTGRLENSVIAFTSDNGFLQGQHRLFRGKIVPYGDSARVPLLISGPAFRRGVSSDAVAANIDLTPTFLELAGAKPPVEPDGVSLVPLLKGQRQGTGRDLVLENLEQGSLGAEGGESPDTGRYPAYHALRTARWLYVDYQDDTQGLELYDLRADPDNLENLASRPRYARVRARLARRLAALESCAGPACYRASPPSRRAQRTGP